MVSEPPTASSAAFTARPCAGAGERSGPRARRRSPTTSGTLTTRRKRSGQPHADERDHGDQHPTRRAPATRRRGGRRPARRSPCRAGSARRRAGWSTISPAHDVGLALVGRADREALAVVRPGLLDQTRCSASDRRWPPPSPSPGHRRGRAAARRRRAWCSTLSIESTYSWRCDGILRAAGEVQPAGDRVGLDEVDADVLQLRAAGWRRGGWRRSTSAACRRRTRRARRTPGRTTMVDEQHHAQAERRRAAPGRRAVRPSARRAGRTSPRWTVPA